MTVIRPAGIFLPALCLLFFFGFCHLHGTNLCGKAVKIDESGGIMMVLKITGGEGGDALIIERIGGSGSLLDDISFVELHFAFAGHVFLGGLYECLKSFS